MTIRIPEETFAEKLLTMMGKKRTVWISSDVYKRFGPYVIMPTKRESFWRALARPKTRRLRRDDPIHWNNTRHL